ncbi:MAG TPA: hypothetical protein VIY48_00120 [Candidatus Paceibacterota bacterium]
MEYKLVNVTGVRDQPFTAELIAPAEYGYKALVGLYEDDMEGNLFGGVSMYAVPGDAIEDTGEVVSRVLGISSGFTPQLV